MQTQHCHIASTYVCTTAGALNLNVLSYAVRLPVEMRHAVVGNCLQVAA